MATGGTSSNWMYGRAHALQLLEHYTGLETDEHGIDTPSRFLTMLDELTQCKLEPNTDHEAHLMSCINWKDFAAQTDEMVSITGIPFVSLCNHHIVPFMGKAHVGYIPDKKMCGLSKAARVVQHFARQLQIQERMTGQITSFLEEHLKPLGLMVVIQAEHMCMTIRGVQAQGALTTTSAVRGVFADHERTAKAEFLQLVNGGLK